MELLFIPLDSISNCNLAKSKQASFFVLKPLRVVRLSFPVMDLCPCKACRTTLLCHHFSYIVSVLPLIKPPYRSRTSPLRAHRLISIAFPLSFKQITSCTHFCILLPRYFINNFNSSIVSSFFSISINKFSTFGGRVLTNRFIFKLFSVCIKNKSTILAISK